MNNLYRHYPKFTLPIIVLLLVGISFANCKKEEDPYTEFDGMSPDVWAPQTLTVADLSISEKMLVWVYQLTNIEGFRLDRKVGNDAWEVGYRNFPKELRSWNDESILPDTNLTYTYRIYACAGDYNSAYDETSSPIVFAGPEC
jgi:hypothetical protein